MLASYEDQQKGRGDDEEMAKRREEIEQNNQQHTQEIKIETESEMSPSSAAHQLKEILRLGRSKREAPKFDSRLHRCLEGELKDLYVAITRARRKLWIFDDRGVSAGGKRNNKSARQLREQSDTMYDYLVRRNLVVTDDDDQAEGIHGNGTGHTNLDDAFDEGSTDEEWKDQAKRFVSSALSKKKEGDLKGCLQFFEFASRCYRKIGNGKIDVQLDALADLERMDLYMHRIRALRADRERAPTKLRRRFYLTASHAFLNVRPQSKENMYACATYLYSSARLHQPNSKSRISQMKKAGKMFELAGKQRKAILCLKETGDVVEASRLYELQNKYILAAGLLDGKNKFDEQIQLAERYSKKVSATKVIQKWWRIDIGILNTNSTNSTNSSVSIASRRNDSLVVVDQLLDISVIARKKAEYWKKQLNSITTMMNRNQNSNHTSSSLTSFNVSTSMFVTSSRDKPKCSQKIREAVSLFEQLEDKIRFLRSPGLNDVDESVKLLIENSNMIWLLPLQELPTETM